MPGQEHTGANRLTIELVPQTCWFSNVRFEVGTADWDRLRKLASDAAEDRCEVCGRRGPRWPVECHEIWEYDDEQHTQSLLGLTAICPACHEVKHIGLANIRGRGDIAARHLAKVNGWTAQEAERYIAEQFAVWERRSKYQWALDLGWLEQHGIAVRNASARR